MLTGKFAMEAGEINDQQGSVAERSKALVLGTSLFGGVGSNPTAASCFSIVPFQERASKWEAVVILCLLRR